MKITVIGPAYPLRGGIAHHVYCIQQEFTRRGHEVQVISFRKLYPQLLFPGKTELDVSSKPLDARADRVLTPLNPFTWRKAIKRVKEFSPDIIIFQWWQPFFGPIMGSLLRGFKRRNFSCVVECHNVFGHEGTPLDRLLARFGLSAADAFITHSKKDRSDLRRIISGKTIRVVPLPTPGEFLSRSDDPRDGKTILFFGKVRKYKGLDVLLAAMPAVISQIDCRLRIVGEFYDSIEKYRDLINTLDLDQYVQIDDRYVPNEEVGSIFARADVLVLPYLSATQSGVAQIALRNGLPIIASRTGGLAEIIIDNVNGLLFPPGDADALANKIVSYFRQNLGPVFAKTLRTNSVEDEDLATTIESMVRDQGRAGATTALQDPA